MSHYINNKSHPPISQPVSQSPPHPNIWISFINKKHFSFSFSTFNRSVRSEIVLSYSISQTTPNSPSSHNHCHQHQYQNKPPLPVHRQPQHNHYRHWTAVIHNHPRVYHPLLSWFRSSTFQVLAYPPQVVCVYSKSQCANSAAAAQGIVIIIILHLDKDYRYISYEYIPWAFQFRLWISSTILRCCFAKQIQGGWFVE